MRQRHIIFIIIIALLALFIWVALPNNPGIHVGNLNRDLKTVLGLDLRGGMQVLLEADVPETTEVTTQALEDTKTILENRSNALGVGESVFQVAGTRRIVAEFPGITNTDEVLSVLKETGQLEFIDTGTTFLAEGTVVQTDLNAVINEGSVEPSIEPMDEIVEPTGEPAETSNEVTTDDTVWHTVLTGDQLDSVYVSTNTMTGAYVISLKFDDAATQTLADHTTQNIGKYLAIVLDKKVISCPTIEAALTEGEGMITGNFTYESANNLAIQLRYGSLPVPMRIDTSSIIGPTLGQDSLQKSLVAGLIGFIIVALFMILYYRLPGFLAILSIVFYALLTFALYKFIPVTLTLPSIAGFLLSTGGALDANILIFERLKEELRSGRGVSQSLDLGWKRAWSSIRDSNLATLITSAILFIFGSTYGATFIKGFALTLALGVIISLLTAAVVTRNFLSVTFNDLIKNPAKHMKLFGL